MKKLLRFLILLLTLCISISASTILPSESSSPISMSEPRWKIKRWAVRNNYNYIVIRSVTEVFKISKPHTIYEIRSSIDLQGGKLQIPSDCYIYFRHGTLFNGEILGKLNNDCVRVSCFGAVQNDGNDDSEAIQNALNVCSGRVIFEGGNYDICKALYIRNSGTTMVGNASVIRVEPTESIRVAINVFSLSNVSIADLSIVSSNLYHSYSAFQRENDSCWSNVLGVVASGVNDFSVYNVDFANLEYAIKIDGREGRNSKVTIYGVYTNETIPMPIYISYSSDVVVDSCNLSASKITSKFDHHIYGCSDNINHEITNCIFNGGSGVPIHYYTEDSTSNKDIVVRKCVFYDTLGGVLISSKAKGSMEVHELIYKSDRKYDLGGVFHADGDNSLSIYNSTVLAPNQYLFSCSSSYALLDLISAEVYALQCALPRVDSKVILQNSDVKLTGEHPLVYVSENNSRELGSVQIVNNSFKINKSLEYIFSIQGTSLNEFRVVGNTFMCEGKVKYIVYNAGAANPNFVFQDNLIYGCPKERHSSVKDGVFVNNIIK